VTRHESAAHAVTWPSIPYKGLSFYTPEDTALFGGRTGDVRTCARILARDSTKILLLHGTTGCGKSSFLRAGLIPFLESEVPRFQFLREFKINSTKARFVPCTDQPLFRLCEMLFDWGKEPLRIEPPDSPSEEIDLKVIRGGEHDRTTFVERNGRSVEELLRVMKALDDLFPKTLVIVLDQAEEILTSGKDMQMDRDRFFDFIAAFGRMSLDLKLVIAFRTEYFGVYDDELEKRQCDRGQVRRFRLTELSKAQLVEAIKMPTVTNIPAKYLGGRCQPFDHYKFDFESGLPERIVEDLLAVETKGGVLPILQIVCEGLYIRAKEAYRSSGRSWRITAHDYSALSRLEEQIDGYVVEKLTEKIVKERPRLGEAARDEEIAAWKDLLYELVVVEADNRALNIRRPREYLKNRARALGCKVDFDAMVAFLADEEQRILRPPENLVDPKTKKTTVYYSLGHDAIAVALSKWRETRVLVLGQRSFVKKAVIYPMRALGVFSIMSALGSAIVILMKPDLRTDIAGELDTALIFGGVILGYLVIGMAFWAGAGLLSRVVIQGLEVLKRWMRWVLGRGATGT
jgi:hypothetical protein